MAISEYTTTDSVLGDYFKIRPMTNVGGLSYRDGDTLLNKIEQLRTFLLTNVLPGIEGEVNRIITDLNGYLMQYHLDIVGTEEEWETLFNSYMADVDASLQALNDVAVTAIVKSPISNLRIALDGIYASKTELTTFKNETTQNMEDFAAAVDDDLALINDTLGGRLSTAQLQDLMKAVRVDARDFMPTAHVKYKTWTGGVQYEVIRVNTGGKPMPRVLGKEYAKNFHLTSPKGDGFIAGPDRAETLQEFAGRTGAPVIFNSTGWQTAEGAQFGMIRGVQIKDGVIYRDFETNSNRGRHALGVHADGTIKPYMIESGATAASMVAAGVVDSFGFGPLLVLNGVQRNVLEDTWASSLTGGAISGRTILGVSSNHEPILITVIGDSAKEIGIGGNDIARIAYDNGCYNAILLDGGGSTQAMADGIVYHPSSDTGQKRTVGDVGVMNVRITMTPDSSIPDGPEMLKLDHAVVQPNIGVYDPRVVARGGIVSLTGTLQPLGGGLWPINTWVTVGLVPDKARPGIPLGAAISRPVSLSSVGGLGKLQIRAWGEISFNIPEASAGVILDGVTYAGQ